MQSYHTLKTTEAVKTGDTVRHGTGVLSNSALGALAMSLAFPAAAAVSLAVAATGRGVAPSGLTLLACGTMVAYGLDRLIDGRTCDPLVVRRAVAAAVALAAVVTLTLACAAPWRLIVCAVLGALAAFYVPLKRFVSKNLLTVVAWTLAVGTLPVAAPPSLTPARAWSLVAVALLVLANTELCDIPHLLADRRAGVIGVVPHFGGRIGAMSAAAVALIAAAASAFAGLWSFALAGVALMSLALPMRHPNAPRWLGLAADAVVIFLPGPIALLIR